MSTLHPKGNSTGTNGIGVLIHWKCPRNQQYQTQSTITYLHGLPAITSSRKNDPLEARSDFTLGYYGNGYNKYYWFNNVT